MADALATQGTQPDVQVDQEWSLRDNRRLARHLKKAKLQMSASFEEIDYHQSPELDRAVMSGLATCDWVRCHQNVLITGPTQVGKTFTA